MLGGLSKILRDRSKERDAKHSRGPPKRRTFHGNRFTSTKTDTTERVCNDSNLIVNMELFQELSKILVCSICNSKVEFNVVSRAGLGLKLEVKCQSCSAAKKLDSCPMTGRERNNIFDINLRSIFAMAMVGHGHQGLETICATMNLPKPINKNSWQEHMKEIADSVEFITRTGFSKSAREEAHLTGDKDSLAVSGDGSWRKQGFASLQGVVSLIGHRTGKVLDIALKNLFCRECLHWQKKEGTAQFEQWKSIHVCDINHEGSAGKMEPDGIKQLFRRSVEKYGVKYSTYIGDGDTKTYKELLNAQPYPEFTVAKKECVGHVQKRFGTRLRRLVQQNKALMGRGMLTGKYIDQLTSYYGKALRQNCHSVEAMQKAVKAIYYHESSTDEQHNHFFVHLVKILGASIKKLKLRTI